MSATPPAWTCDAGGVAATNAEIRAWARENGYTVAERGRISGAVVAAYAAAHPVEPVVDDEPDLGDPDPMEAGRTYAYAPPDQDLAPGAVPDQSHAPPGVPPRPPWTPSFGPPPTEQVPTPTGPPPAWGAPPPPPGHPPAPPSWGRPPPGQEWTPPGATSSGQDGFAVAALVTGLLPCVGILGIVFGAVALGRIRKSAKKGRVMAIAGIVLGTLWLLAVGISIALGVAGEADRADDGSVTRRGSVSVDALRAGDCPTSLPDGVIRTIDLVPCSQPHRAEVYSTFTLTGSRFPGEDETIRLANGGCLERLITFVGRPRESSFEIYYLTPTSATWALGDRTVHCLLTTANGSLLPPGSAKAP